MSDQRRMRRDLGRALRLRVAHERTDLDLTVTERDTIEARHAIDVNDELRPAQPHVQRGDQALSAGQEARILRAHQLDGVIERAGSLIGERRRLHAILPHYAGRI